MWIIHSGQKKKIKTAKSGEDKEELEKPLRVSQKLNSIITEYCVFQPSPG